MNLLALYKHFFVDQVPNIAWHDRYANISLLLESYRHLLDKTKQKKILNDHAQELIDHYDTAVKDQNNILELLIGDPAGIAGAGQSLLSADNYKHLISKQEFIDSLYSLITEPNIANFKDFAENWCKFNLKGKNINWLRINRVAAACTTNVSVLCDSKKFNQVFNWLQSKCPADFGMAAYSKWISDTYPNYTDLNDNLVNNNTIDWFIRNEFILDRLKQIISAGINTDNKFQYENYQPHLLQLNLSKDTDYDNREFLYERWILKDTRDEQLRRVVYDPYYLSMFLWYLYTYNYSFINNNTVVKYGAPGTGKTYTAKREAEFAFDNWKIQYGSQTDCSFAKQHKLVQFHPSYSYEDFIEGLRPQLNPNGQAVLALQNGTFKKFCCQAGMWEKDVYELYKQHKKDCSWDNLTIAELEEQADQEFREREHWKYIFALEDKSAIVCEAIPPFFFIIDEINRAELSRVFGELMYCLEYRGPWEGLAETQYASLNNDETGMLKVSDGEYRFFIPHNVYIIGTMNNIDRSVESFDFALRRRFRWERVNPSKEVLKNYLDNELKRWPELAEWWESLNNMIAKQDLLGKDYCIGHAYLMQLEKFDENWNWKKVRQVIWDDFIQPLLDEYLRGTGGQREDIKTKCKEAFFTTIAK